MSELIKIGITHGDINGIGYEVIMKALADESITEIFTPVIFGYRALAEEAKSMTGIPDIKLNVVADASKALPGKINIVELKMPQPVLCPGEITKEAGMAAVEALEMASDAFEKGDIDVIVTAPISKEAAQNETFNFPGQTEYFQQKFGDGEKAQMILFNDSLRVALLTVHLPLANVASQVTFENIVDSVERFSYTLKQDFGIVRPKIAVLSLNPHSGDGGLIGTEEENIIIPALEELRENGILAFGPFAADGFFGHGDYKGFDGILAIYHDQGLAPFKTLASGGGVNFTAGLPLIRTSPDHGTAFGIAWKNMADGSSMREAIYSAIDIWRRRESFQEAAANPLKKYSSDRPDRGERQERPS